LCPKSSPWSKSNWEAVGCKRGDLKTNMACIKLCSHPGTVKPDPWELIQINGQPEPCEPANNCLQESNERRERELRTLATTAGYAQNQVPGVIAFASYPSGPLFLPSIPVYSLLQGGTASSPALNPLNECISAIAWEFHDRPSNSTILGARSINSLINLLRYSAIYQAKLESVSIVTSVKVGCDNWLI
jgi:hypothetical protein